MASKWVVPVRAKASLTSGSRPHVGPAAAARERSTDQSRSSSRARAQAGGSSARRRARVGFERIAPRSSPDRRPSGAADPLASQEPAIVELTRIERAGDLASCPTASTACRLGFRSACRRQSTIARPETGCQSVPLLIAVRSGTYRVTTRFRSPGARSQNLRSGVNPASSRTTPRTRRPGRFERMDQAQVIVSPVRPPIMMPAASDRPKCRDQCQKPRDLAAAHQRRKYSARQGHHRPRQVSHGSTKRSRTIPRDTAASNGASGTPNEASRAPRIASERRRQRPRSPGCRSTRDQRPHSRENGCGVVHRPAPSSMILFTPRTQADERSIRGERWVGSSPVMSPSALRRGEFHRALWRLSLDS